MKIACLQDHSTLSQICTRYLQPVYSDRKPRGGNVNALGERKRLHSAPRRPVIVKAATSVTEEEQEGYDVYVNEPTKLEEGVCKRTLSVFVADESGLINRVAGVFARRGANIESLAVGLTVDKALFTIVATGTPGTVANLCKQISKLVNVRFVEDITNKKYVERELVFLKVQAASGPERTEITQLAQIFRARIVDVGESTFILAITGDPGKLTAFQKVLSKFGVVELVRTGRIALKRGESLFDDGNGATFFEGNKGGSDSPSTSATRVEYANSGLDVYAADAIETGVWNVSNILDAAYTPEAHGFEPFTLSIDVQDVPGVLNQVTGVIARRGYNVQSLAVGNSEKPGMSRITMVVPGDSASIANLTKQLLKLVYVSSVTELHRIPHVARELMLVKVACQPSQRGEILDLTKIFHASVCDVSRSTMMIEVVGKESKMRALQEVLQPYGILEIARTGRVALARDSGVDSRYLSGMAGSRIML